MLLLIDNYDSFTYNLYQEIGNRTKQAIRVVKNDQVTVADLDDPNLTGLILSPGPGRPEDAGNMNTVLAAAIGKVPIFGVCLGHQAIGQVYGAKVIHAPLMHGKTSPVRQGTGEQTGIFAGCSATFTVGRYHSLMLDPKTIPANLSVTARALDDGSVQAVADEANHVYGVEFHPESIMTEGQAANQIFLNFLAYTEEKNHD